MDLEDTKRVDTFPREMIPSYTTVKSVEDSLLAISVKVSKFPFVVSNQKNPFLKVDDFRVRRNYFQVCFEVLKVVEYTSKI